MFKGISEKILPDKKPFKVGDEFDRKISENGEHTSRIFYPEGDESVLVKQLKIRKGTKTYAEYSEEDFRLHYQRTLDYLKNFLGDYIPDTQLVYGYAGRFKNKKCGFAITEKVFPAEGLGEKELLEGLSQLDDIFSKIVAVWDGLKDNFPVMRPLPDFTHRGNLKFGYTKNNPKPQYYLVDIYPLVDMSGSELIKYMNDAIGHYAAYHDFLKTKQALEKLPKDILKNESLSENNH